MPGGDSGHSVRAGERSGAGRAGSACCSSGRGPAAPQLRAEQLLPPHPPPPRPPARLPRHLRGSRAPLGPPPAGTGPPPRRTKRAPAPLTSAPRPPPRTASAPRSDGKTSPAAPGPPRLFMAPRLFLIRSSAIYTAAVGCRGPADGALGG